jgi:mannitol-specific phosphotransferase system IIBC component
LIITSKPLAERVKTELAKTGLPIPVFPVDNLLNATAYDKIIAELKQHG